MNGFGVTNTLECSYREQGIGKILSNLYPHQFMFRERVFASMEGFLQSLKTTDLDTAVSLACMHGIQAWKEGQKYNWKETQLLHFEGIEYKRESEEYIALIASAYDALFDQCTLFRNALALSHPKVLTHDGKSDKKDSVLTVSEYIGNLTRLRESIVHR
jgi:hypothetical protein